MSIENRKAIKHFVSKKLLKFYLGEKILEDLKYFANRNETKENLKENPNKKQMQFPSKIAIVFLGTDKYIKFFPKYYVTIKRKFLTKTIKKFFVLTDKIHNPYLKKKDITIVPVKHTTFPFSTLLRFRYMDKISKKLKSYSHIIFIDADMYINCFISEKEFFFHNKPLFGVRHPNFLKKRGTFEYNLNSLASVNQDDDLSIYIQGCFWGGKTNSVLKLIKILNKRINEDLKKKIIAIFHDESHLNKYFIENKELFYIYNLSYAYSSARHIPKPFKKKIIHFNDKKIRAASI